MFLRTRVRKTLNDLYCLYFLLEVMVKFMRWAMGHLYLKFACIYLSPFLGYNSIQQNFKVRGMKRIINECTEIWYFSSSVQLEISQVRAVKK